MGMFIVEAGTPIRAIKNGKEWYDPNFTDTKTKKVNVFDKHELIVDPAGISKDAVTSASIVTVGGAYARAGWYAFRTDSWTMLVHAQYVTYA